MITRITTTTIIILTTVILVSYQVAFTANYNSAVPTKTEYILFVKEQL